jgi:hypothetical protein
MNRIQKYKESLNKFIKDKSCLINKKDIENKQISLVHSWIKKNDLLYSILLLTVMNNQNKKNHISMQGYFIASCVEFVNCFCELMEHRKEFEENFPPVSNQQIYQKTSNYLLQTIHKSLQQNIESIKGSHTPQILIGIIINLLSITNTELSTINSLCDFKFEVNDIECNRDIINWYLKKNPVLKAKFLTFKQVKKESMDSYIEIRYETICNLSIKLGWVIGGGDIKQINNIKSCAKHFAVMYKISRDFESLDEDIKKSNQFTTNYVLNYGLQDSYEMFLNNKQAFIEQSMLNDIYTNTIKEIIDTIEVNVDMIIDQTSPDLKSNYSSSNKSTN